MKSDSREAYINYRIERSYETFSDAKILAENERWNSCINRLYYSCFYMVFALLFKNGIETKTHSGARTQFFKEFIVSQKVSKDFGKLYSDLFDWRNEGDYGDFIEFDKTIVLPTIEKSSEFLSALESLIKEVK